MTLYSRCPISLLWMLNCFIISCLINDLLIPSGCIDHFHIVIVLHHFRLPIQHSPSDFHTRSGAWLQLRLKSKYFSSLSFSSTHTSPLPPYFTFFILFIKITLSIHVGDGYTFLLLFMKYYFHL